MAKDNEFINGLIVKAPHDNAPDYVKAKVSIKREELIGWLNTRNDDWINADIKVSQTGKWYAAVDDWKPNQGNGSPRNNAPRPQRREPERPFDEVPLDDDIPFATNRGMY